MNYTLEIKRALDELKRITGISLEVSAGSEEEAEDILNQVRCLNTAYKEKYNVPYFLQGLMTGEIAPAYASDRAARLHIKAAELRILFLLETRTAFDDTVLEILKNLFPSQTKALLIPLDTYRIAVLKPLKGPEESEESFQHLAHVIVDTLGMEALTHVQAAYSRIICHLSELPEAYKETVLALKVGKIFYTSQTVFPYNRLGIGRLIYHIPTSVCENFLQEVYGSSIPETLDEEVSATVERFLQNNLNIAETARQLHMHRNTLIYRLDQLEKQTGLDLRNFEDAMTFKIVTMIFGCLKNDKNK